MGHYCSFVVWADFAYRGDKRQPQMAVIHTKLSATKVKMGCTLTLDSLTNLAFRNPPNTVPAGGPSNVCCVTQESKKTTPLQLRGYNAFFL